MNYLEEIKELLAKELAGSKVQVGDLTGTSDHLDILIGCDQFRGQSLLQQHQMVMDILKPQFSDRLHAVKIKTMTLEKWNETFQER